MTKLTAAQRARLGAKDFAVPETGQLPIDTAARTRAAMARFNQTHFDSEAQAERAYRRILKRAAQFGIDAERFAEEYRQNPPSVEECRRVLSREGRDSGRLPPLRSVLNPDRNPPMRDFTFEGNFRVFDLYEGEDPKKVLAEVRRDYPELDVRIVRDRNTVSIVGSFRVDKKAAKQDLRNLLIKKWEMDPKKATRLVNEYKEELYEAIGQSGDPDAEPYWFAEFIYDHQDDPEKLRRLFRRDASPYSSWNRGRRRNPSEAKYPILGEQKSRSMKLTGNPSELAFAISQALNALAENDPNGEWAYAEVRGNVAVFPDGTEMTLAELDAVYAEQMFEGNPVQNNLRQNPPRAKALPDGVEYTIVNPEEVLFYADNRHLRESGLYLFQFGAVRTTWLAVWSDSLESALEAAAEYLAEEAPGHVMAHDSDELKELVKEALPKGKSMDQWYKALERQEQWAYDVEQEATADLTYTESGYLTSYEWWAQEVAKSDPSYLEIFEASIEDLEIDEDEEEAIEKVRAKLKA